MKNTSFLLKKLRRLTNDVGIYQHGKLNQPDPVFGYALEDQARALIITHKLGIKNLEKIYFDFIIRAQNKDTFFNQYYYEDRGFIEDITPATVFDKEEAYGIVLWALLSTNHYQDKRINSTVTQLKDKASSWTSPRAIATALLGLSNLPQSSLEKNLIEKIQNLYVKTATNEWQWFENYLTYANAILPWACWEVSINRNNSEAKRIAEESTNFLIEQCQIKGVPAPIGNNGWYKKGGEKALFDQQPIDVAYMICCLEKAFLATKNRLYLDWAKKWWGWFWGNNLKKISLIDEKYACFDGLTSYGVNLNQGAESNICFLMAAVAADRLGIWELE